MNKSGGSWNKGLTKETDPRVAKMAEGISRSLKGCLTWNKGLTKDTDNRLLEASKKQSIVHTGNISCKRQKINFQKQPQGNGKILCVQRR